MSDYFAVALMPNKPKAGQEKLYLTPELATVFTGIPTDQLIDDMLRLKRPFKRLEGTDRWFISNLDIETMATERGLAFLKV